MKNTWRGRCLSGGLGEWSGAECADIAILGAVVADSLSAATSLFVALLFVVLTRIHQGDGWCVVRVIFFAHRADIDTFGCFWHDALHTP